MPRKRMEAERRNGTNGTAVAFGCGMRVGAAAAADADAAADGCSFGSIGDVSRGSNDVIAGAAAVAFVVVVAKKTKTKVKI